MPTDDFSDLDQDFTLAETQWWLASLGNVMVWARLRVFSSGSADVLSSDGELIHYQDQREACVALMDANYAALDGMDEDDALAFDRELEELVPPTAESDADEDLVPLLIEQIDANRTPGTGHI
jgi:hypothetical protein